MLEGHERCISIEKFKLLQELHDAQKKIIAKLQQENQTLKDVIAQYQRKTSRI